MGAASISARTEKMMGLLQPLLGRMARNDAFTLPADISDQSRMLIIDSGELTEVLFFSPILKYLKNKYPGMRVTFLVREGNSELVRTMSQINEMITYEPSHLSLTSTTYLSLLKRVRHRDFSIVFMLGSQFNFARSLLTLFTRANIRVGFTSEFATPFINCEIRLGRGMSYEGTKAHAFLTALGMMGYESLPGWSLPKSDLRWAKQLIHFHKPKKETPLIAVDPGMGKGRHRLVDDSFAYLVNHAADHMSGKVLVLSNNLDKKSLEKFRSKLRARALDLEPKNVKEGLALLSCAGLLLAGNTDYFHFAVSMRTPTIGLFTRHDEARWFPKGTPWVQILQGVKGQRLSLEEFESKIDTLLHLTNVV